MAKASELHEVTLRVALDGFLSSPKLKNPNTLRAYAAVLDRIAADVGAERPVAAVSGDELADAVEKGWTTAAPATWNRNRAVLSSFLSWCVENRYPVSALPPSLERRAEHPDKTSLPTGVRRAAAVRR